MGRKGGGRAGFVKSARAARADGDAEDPDVASVPPAPSESSVPAQQPAVGKAAAFLKDEPPAAAADDSDGSDEEGGVETRGKMLQRHKREQKALKDQIKRLGKKGKDEGARLEADMAARHAAELAALDSAKQPTAADVVAVADSLYAVHLDGSEGGEGKKPSKGQRRREQRQREEAEREARIEAELAELGDTDRVIEERELKAILAPLGLGIHEIPPDGHCLYRSLEDQLQRLPASVAPPPAGEGDGEGDALNFLLLRQRAAAHMRRHADEFKPFVLEEDVSTSGGSGDDAFEAYCSELESTAAWGGQVELQALAHALQSHIVVYSVGMPVLEMGEEYIDTGRTLRVCYLRHAYGLGEHYESVVPGLIAVGDEEDAEGADAAATAAAADP